MAMQAQRAMQQTARRFVAQQRSPAYMLTRYTAPSLAIGQTRSASISNPIATQTKQDDGLQILANQRLYRPVAPHLGIYQPQVTWLLSSFNRITGVTLSGSLYIFGALYAVAPLIGLKITAAGMAAGFAKWPLVAKLGTKIFFALPFTFHCFNGLRHLMWDVGSGINNAAVKQTGYAVIALTAVSTAALAFLW